MSVQLVVYPQNYEGQFNVVSQGTTTDFIVDGINFSTVNGSSTYEAVSPTFNNMIINAPTTIPNTWYRARTIQAPTVTPYATMSGNKITFGAGSNTGGDPSNSYLYQRLTNLTIGQEYTITAELESMDVGGTFSAVVYMGATIEGIWNYPGVVSLPTTITGTFIAQVSTTLDIYLWYHCTSGSTTDTCVLNNIYVTETGVTPTYATNLLTNGHVILDLYENEDIPLTLSVDNFKNAAEQVQSYSKAFNLPATKRNNQIFDNVFEIIRSSDGIVFNPYRKTQCVLKQDGFTIFEGYLRMIDITDKGGEISYNVNMYSEAIALADVLNNRKFSDLDFSELEHDYTYSEIRNSWAGQLGLTNPLPVGTFAGTAGASETNVLKYPFVDWSHQFTADPDTGYPMVKLLENAFRPFIKIRYIVDMIFNQTTQSGTPFPFTFTSNFFETTEFTNLFMDFNWGDTRGPRKFETTGNLCLVGDFAVPHNSYTTVTFNEMSEVSCDLGDSLGSSFGYDSSTGEFTAVTDNQTYSISMEIEFDKIGIGGNPELHGSWVHEDSAGNIIDEIDEILGVSFGINWVYSQNCTVVLNQGDKLYFRIKNTGTDDNCEIEENTSWGCPEAVLQCETNAANTADDSMLQTLRGELGQWEFLKGLFTMFNLVALQDKSNPNNLIIEPYADIFLNNTDSKQFDWTSKVDISEMKLQPLTDLNKTTIFKFVEDDDDYAFQNYKQSVQQHLYGSQVFDAGSGFNVLEGTEEIVAEPFGATVIKPLMEQFADFIVPTIYSYDDSSDESSSFDNSPRIMYDNGIKTLGTCTYNVFAQNGAAGDAFEDEFLQFSHLSSQPPSSSTMDFHFGICQLIPAPYSPTSNNLFNLFWLPYFGELYNPNTRMMTVKVNLSAGDVSEFKFIHRIMIKNREFRVNRIDYKPHDLSTVEFILIP